MTQITITNNSNAININWGDGHHQSIQHLTIVDIDYANDEMGNAEIHITKSDSNEIRFRYADVVSPVTANAGALVLLLQGYNS